MALGFRAGEDLGRIQGMHRGHRGAGYGIACGTHFLQGESPRSQLFSKILE